MAAMDNFPAFLNLRDRAVLVVGGGSVAERKIARLLEAAALVHVVAPDLTEHLERQLAAGAFTHQSRKFLPDDVSGCWLAVSATGIAAVDSEVREAADRAQVFCNAVDNAEACTFISPAVVDRSPLIIAISSGGAAPVLARQIRAKLETLLPQSLGALTALARSLRSDVKRRIHQFRDRRRFWERFFDGSVQRSLERDGSDAAHRHALNLLQSSQPTTGHAWLVGAGPGDPELLTLKGLQALQQADIVLYDRLVSPEVLNLARRDADLRSVGKQPGCQSNSQEHINDLLVELVAAGNRVCRLKGGDPTIFGRGGEEAEALAKAGLSCSIVPGITAAAGCAAAAGIPLTHRNAAQSVTFVTAHGKEARDRLDWRGLARSKQTLAFYMGVKRFPTIVRELIRNGRASHTPIAVIERGTTASQRVVKGRLGQLTLLASAHRIQAPAILIVGEVAAMAADISESPAIDPRAVSEPFDPVRSVTLASARQ